MDIEWLELSLESSWLGPSFFGYVHILSYPVLHAIEVIFDSLSQL